MWCIANFYTPQKYSTVFDASLESSQPKAINVFLFGILNTNRQMLPLHVKIDVTHVRYAVIRSALKRLECEQTKDDPTTRIVWWDGFIAFEKFQTILPHQRINKIPGMDVLCYKNSFFQALGRMKALFPSFYTFLPQTYLVPQQYNDFQREHQRIASRGATATWIVKPQSGCGGNGIKLIQSSYDIAGQSQKAIVQKYVSPFLIDGYKFDFRLFILIATLKPFTVYLYGDGLCRYCSVPYVAPTSENLGNRFCHLTNTAVNVGNKERQHLIMELASSALEKIAAADERGKTLWNRIKQVVLLSVIALYPEMLKNAAAHTPPPEVSEEKPPAPPVDDTHKYFHILGIDIMVNDRCEPVVLELNDRPSMCVTYKLERGLKTDLVYDALNIVSIDGRPPDANAKPGKWQKLFPAEDNLPFGKAASTILLRGCQAVNKEEQAKKKKIFKKLGYTPKPTARKRISKVKKLPPLRQ